MHNIEFIFTIFQYLKYLLLKDLNIIVGINYFSKKMEYQDSSPSYLNNFLVKLIFFVIN
jgi:hypothetical protein